MRAAPQRHAQELVGSAMRRPSAAAAPQQLLARGHGGQPLSVQRAPAAASSSCAASWRRRPSRLTAGQGPDASPWCLLASTGLVAPWALSRGLGLRQRRRGGQHKVGLLALAAAADSPGAEAEAASASASGRPERGRRLGGADLDLLRWVSRRLDDTRLESAEEQRPSGCVFLETGLPPGARSFNTAELLALLRLMRGGDADFVAYPIKDVPLSIPAGLILAAVLRRGEAREALVVRKKGPQSWSSEQPPGTAAATGLAALPDGAVISISSLRRRLQLQALHPRLVIKHTGKTLSQRLRRLHNGRGDAVVAAAEGLTRLGFDGFELLDPSEVMPAFGQGAVGLLCRAEDRPMVDFLARWDDADSRLCVECERVLLRRIGRLSESRQRGPFGTPIGPPLGSVAGMAVLCAGPGAGAGAGAAEAGGRELHLRCSVLRMTPDMASGLTEVHPHHFLAERCCAVAAVDTVPAAAKVRHALLARVDALAAEMEEEMRQLLDQAEASVVALAPGSTPSDLLPADLLAADLPAATAPPAAEEGAGAAAPEGERNRRPPQPPLFASEARTPVDDVDCSGTTRYIGQVCAVLTRKDGTYAGAVIDINADVPARWYPERSDDSGRRLALGAEVAVYCFWRQAMQLRVVLHEPARLERRGAGRTPLAELRAGSGPFRAIVVSCTASGTLVDFNCEVVGYLMSSKALASGEEIRVYCYEVDADQGICRVGMQPLPSWRTATALRVENLDLSGATSYKGTVQRVTPNGALVDFNCEVPGVMDAKDIDIQAAPDLEAGSAVQVYVISTGRSSGAVTLSMFRPRPQDSASAAGGPEGSTRGTKAPVLRRH